MKYVVMLSLMLLTACSSSSGGGGSSGGSAAIAPTISPTPVPTATPTPTPSPTPVVCQPFVGTHWIADGAPTLTPNSADQPGHYVEEFDMTGANPTFTEVQYISPTVPISCLRVFNAGVVSSDSIIWTDTSGSCGAVAAWLQFDLSQCNVVTVLIRDGLGAVYETQAYKPL